MKRLALVFLSALAGCSGGGGGGGDDGTPFFGGVWTGDFNVVSDNCNGGTGFTDDKGFVLTVNQEDRTIVADTPSGNVYQGTVTGDDSFTVSRVFSAQCDSGTPATVSRQFDFSNVDGDVATVTFTSTSRCDGSIVTCDLVERGTLTRN